IPEGTSPLGKTLRALWVDQQVPPLDRPVADPAPKPKENGQRPPPPAFNNSNKTKRSKQEEHDDVLEERKNGTNGNGNARARRKGKDKDRNLVTLDNIEHIVGEDEHGDALLEEGLLDPEAEDEEGGITRCICGDEDGQGGFMAQCEMCEAWQHGKCMGFGEEADLPEHYYCEQCRPDLYVDLLRRHAKRARQASNHSLHTVGGHGSRTSRSRSPVAHLKPTKRRNTMNSRDAAYEESFQALLEATAAEAAAKEKEALATANAPNGVDAEVNGHDELEADDVAVSSRRKRKRSDDDGVTTKRARSASISSDRTAVASVKMAREPTPSVNNAKSNIAPVSTNKTGSRNRRGGGRKSQAQDLVSVDGEEVAAPSSRSRQPNSRAKATTGNEPGSRRAYANSANSAGASGSHVNSAAASRAYHHSHAYAVSQQPLFTSWGLPDYLAHLEPMLPTDVPQPLEVRGSGIDSTGRESLERNTERGVKVKWPGKRMSVSDMNKRVRALVEWVGREQASALERGRRREAVEKALREVRQTNGDSHSGPDENLRPSMQNGDPMATDGPVIESPLQEKSSTFLDTSSMSHFLTSSDSASTMKVMEELMEELINFQERFGPGAKVKERERRNVSS
ncbi:hypothetical protein EVJ58_g9229, partial [Rhodofomes roseus]